MSNTLTYLQENIGQCLAFKLKNGRTIFGKLESVDDMSEVVSQTENGKITSNLDFEILLTAPIEMVGSILLTQQGPAPIEMPLPYFSLAPSTSIPFMKTELSMMAECSKEQSDMWQRANSPIDLESKIQLPT